MPTNRTLRWRPIGGVGLEHLEVRYGKDGIEFSSAVVGERDGDSYGLFYRASLDQYWVFRALEIERTDGKTLALAHDGSGNWLVNGDPAPSLSKCIDIDLAFSPLTNTLPIRRARLIEGVPQQLTMAFVPHDSLVPFADEQIYTLLGHDTYRYAAADGSFQAELTVDPDGFVISYPPLFERH